MSRPRKLRQLALVEPLEVRRLLSASTELIAHPLDTVPAGNPSPVGLTPAQIRIGLCGISSVLFGSVVGDGTGQTIAVINAFDNPDLVDLNDPNWDNSDLHQFDVQFGLPDPPAFTKVDQTGGTSVYHPTTDPSWANTNRRWTRNGFTRSLPKPAFF